MEEVSLKFQEVTIKVEIETENLSNEEIKSEVIKKVKKVLT